MKKSREAPPPPRQSRAIRTREKLLAALEHLLKSQSFEDIAVTDIAAAAGVSVGSVYSHFADKDAFLAALLELWRSRIAERLRMVQQSDLEAEYRSCGSLYKALLVVVAHGHEQVSADAHIIRATEDYLRSCNAEEWRPWDELRREAYETIALLVDIYTDEVVHKDKEKAKKMLNYFLSISLAERCVNGEHGAYGAMALADAAFCDEVVQMTYAYLTTPTPGSEL